MDIALVNISIEKTVNHYCKEDMNEGKALKLGFILLEKASTIMECMDSDKIKKLAEDLDDAIESGDEKQVLSFFSNDCMLEVFNLQIKGISGVIKAFRWMLRHLKNIKLIPITIMVEGNIFFEEFIVKAETPNGNRLEMKQAEVLEYDSEYKVKSLRLYFDRLLLAEASAANVIEKWLVKLISSSSIKGLT